LLQQQEDEEDDDETDDDDEAELMRELEKIKEERQMEELKQVYYPIDSIFPV
jgi:chromatin segregation and condensation protein Rec8/ScpA/Scc1 (kleisin family)